ncbi:MAG: mercury methylation corrinoid protein HgcA, partial [Planctomycetota bacterium]
MPEPETNTPPPSGKTSCCEPADEDICCRELHGVQVGADGCCCEPDRRPRWVVGAAESPMGPVPQVATRLSVRDHLSAVAVRIGIGRMRYSVSPGLYAVGAPTADAPVLVTANYKLTLDAVRKELTGLDAWLLALDTKGVNVWCAAGKGTFGTDELVTRIEATALADVVTHRELILPQLGAPGVAAHEVTRRSGFRVIYGPVRAADIKAFVAADRAATPEMRRVRFNLRDRLAVAPMELAQAGPWVLAIAAMLAVLASLTTDGIRFSAANWLGLRSAAVVVAAYLGGALLTPLLLPILPGRALSIKGAIVGLAVAAAATAAGAIPLESARWAEAVALWLLASAVSAFLAMNYTGATTYTSLSGVKREMR